MSEVLCSEENSKKDSWEIRFGEELSSGRKFE